MRRTGPRTHRLREVKHPGTLTRVARLPAEAGRPALQCLHMARFRKRSSAKKEFFNERHRFEHWYRDNTVYFITSRCRDQFHAFKSEEAKQIFWDRFEHYRTLFEFVPWIVTLMSNHYH